MGSTPMYELQYLPLFYDDLLATVKYLSEVLHNPKAANKLIDDVENAILNRLPNAEAFEPFHSLKERRYPYYLYKEFAPSVSLDRLSASSKISRSLFSQPRQASVMDLP